MKSVPASEAWELYSTLRYERSNVELMPELFDKIDVLEGSDGKAGNILLICFKAGEGFPANLVIKERYLVVDDERRVKVAEVAEGWFLENDLISFKSKFEITEKPKKEGEEEEESCILKYGIDYEAKEKPPPLMKQLLSI